MLTGAMLGLMEQIGRDILVLTEEINETEFFTSRLTRAKTLQLLDSLAKTASNLPPDTRKLLTAVDWAAWAELAAVLAQPSAHHLQIWVAIKELTPLTLQHLHDYRRTQPELFSLAPRL